MASACIYSCCCCCCCFFCYFSVARVALPTFGGALNLCFHLWTRHKSLLCLPLCLLFLPPSLSPCSSHKISPGHLPRSPSLSLSRRSLLVIILDILAFVSLCFLFFYVFYFFFFVSFAVVLLLFKSRFRPETPRRL